MLYIFQHTQQRELFYEPPDTHQPVSTTIVRGSHLSLESYKDGVTTDPFWRLRKQAQSGHMASKGGTVDRLFFQYPLPE